MAVGDLPVSQEESKMRTDNEARLLIIASVIVGVPRWAGAFLAADLAEIPLWLDDVLNVANMIAGIGMGILEVLAAKYVLEAWSQLKPKKTWNAKSYDWPWLVLTVGIGGLFLMMAVILTPYLVARMNGETVGAALSVTWLQYGWSLMVVLSPAYIVGIVSFSARFGGRIPGTPATKSRKVPARAKEEPAEASSKPALPAVEPAQASTEPAGEPAQSQPVFECGGCGRAGFKSQAAVNAHQRFCPARQNGTPATISQGAAAG